MSGFIRIEKDIPVLDLRKLVERALAGSGYTVGSVWQDNEHNTWNIEVTSELGAFRIEIGRTVPAS